MNDFEVHPIGTDRELRNYRAMYDAMCEASDDEFEMLSAQFRRHCDRDPEAVARELRGLAERTRGSDTRC